MQRAAADGNPQVEPLHLLAALVEQADGTAAPLLRAVGADPALIAKQAAERLDRLPRAQRRHAQRAGNVPPAADGGRHRIQPGQAARRRVRLDRAPAGRPGRRRGPARRPLLSAAGVTPEALLEAFSQIRGGARVTSAGPEDTYKALEKYGVDLTQQARDGKLDPVIGRDAEIRRVIQVLSRRTKNNPVLIGEPGVGKTAIVEGLAQRIVARRRARVLRGKRLVAWTSAPWWPGPSTAASSRSGSRPY